MNSAGKMKSAAGNSIFTGRLRGPLLGNGAAPLARVVGEVLSVRASESPSCSPWMIARTNEATSGVSTRLAIRLSARSLLSPDAELREDERELVRERSVARLDEPLDRAEEAETGLDARRPAGRAPPAAPPLIALAPRARARRSR